MVTKQRTRAASGTACASRIQQYLPRCRSSRKQVGLGHFEKNPSPEDHLGGLSDSQKDSAWGRLQKFKGGSTCIGKLWKKELLVMGFSEDPPDLSYQKKISFGTPDTPRGTNTRSQIRVLFCFLCYFSLCSLLLQLWWSQRQLSKSSRGRT